ncbi:MAG: Uma2 family endonuclease, partial [Chloroflexi bacterium]|nr:Uma2 family endonuclease [Chloroflexota bacterium]
MTTTSDTISMVTRADHVPGPGQGHWTYNHYAALDDGQRYEIINGVLFMTPSPSGPHQDAVLRLSHYLLMYVEFADLGKVRVAPFDVELAPDMVVQPDVLVVLKANFDKIKHKRIVGAPDLVVEVSSPGTVKHDWREKFDTYARAGVSEYWLADPATRSVEIFALEGGTYHSLGTFSEQAKLR